MKGAVFSDDYDVVLFEFRGNENLFTMRMRSAIKVDYHSEGFYRTSVEAGGSGIEKVAIGDRSVIDPYGALDLLYEEGRIPFIINNHPLPKDDGFQENTSKLSLLLRHLRFTRDLGTSITEDEMKSWKVFVELESKNGVEANNFFIEKQLEKLETHFRWMRSWISEDGRQIASIPYLIKTKASDVAQLIQVMEFTGLEKKLSDSGYPDIIPENLKIAKSCRSLFN